MAKEKSPNTEEVLKNLKNKLEKEESELTSVNSIELDGGNTIKKGQKKAGEYKVKSIKVNKEGKKVIKLELKDGTGEYELEEQKLRDEDKNIETIWRKSGTTEGLRIGFPNNEHIEEKVEEKEKEEDVPQITVMENKKEQPIKIEDSKTKMPKVEKIDGKISAPRIGSKFFMMNEEKKMENYTIIGTRIAKKDGQLLLRIKKNPEDREEEPKEINSKQFVNKFNKEKILLTTKDDKRIEELTPFSKKRREQNKEIRNKNEEDVLNEIAENADKNREELMNEEKEPKTLDELKTHHEIGMKMDEVLLKSLSDIEKKKLEKQEKYKNISKDTKDFLKMERNKKYTQDKIDLEERRHEEFADPKITDKDAIDANPDMKALFNKDPEKYLEENKEKAILAFKYLNKVMKIEELAKNTAFKKANQNITGLNDEDFAKAEAKKWQFKFDEINKKYDDELDSIVSKEMKSRTQRTTNKMRKEWENKEAAKTSFDHTIDAQIERAKGRLKTGIEKKAEEISKKLDVKIDAIHQKSEEKFNEIELAEIKKAEEAKDQARKEYIEAKNQKQSFWKFGFGKDKKENELKEKEEAYKKAKEEYVDASGKDQMDFFLEEKQKFQTENIEKKGLSERMKNGIKGGMNLWENWDKNEKDTKFTQHLKKAGKTFVKIAIIGGASVVTVSGLAGVGIGTATALAGGVGSYVGKKAVIGTAFASMINSVPEKHRWWVSLGITAPLVISGGLTTVGIAGVAGIAGYMGSKLIKNKSEENIKAEVDAKIQALKEKQNQKVDKESFEDFEKRQNAIEKELALIEKTASRDRFYRNTKKGALALLIGTATIEMSGSIQDYKDHHQPREYVPRDHDTIPKPIPHPTPTPETHTLNPDAIIHKGEGIENAFIRQIEHNTEMAKSLGWDGKENLHHFAQHEAHALAIKEGYVDGNGNEIRVNVADKVGYEIKMENGHATVFEKSLDGKLTDIPHHEGDSFEKNTEKYEYKTTGNTHLEKPVPATEESAIHLEKPTPVFEEGNTHILHPEKPNFEFTQVDEAPLNLRYEAHNEAPVIENTGPRNLNAFYTANATDTNIGGFGRGYFGNQIGYHNDPYELHQQFLAQVTEAHDQSIHHIFKNDSDYYDLANKPASDFMKMNEADVSNPEMKNLIHHLHKIRASTDIEPHRTNIFRTNPETVDHYINRVYEYANKKGKLDEIIVQ
ncbi:MAG: hypothetical protein V4504_01450 [Patescibacteria group bacterium]